MYRNVRIVSLYQLHAWFAVVMLNTVRLYVSFLSLQIDFTLALYCPLSVTNIYTSSSKSGDYPLMFGTDFRFVFFGDFLPFCKFLGLWEGAGVELLSNVSG